MKLLKLLLLGLLFICIPAMAATVYTPVALPNEYYKYDVATIKKEVTSSGVVVTTTNVTTKYLLTTDITSVRDNYTRVGGVWIKNLSTGGAIKYFEQVVNVPPVVDECVATFVCHKSWGWIVVVPENQVLKCIAIKITNEKAAFFDAAVSVNGEPACVVYP